MKRVWRWVQVALITVGAVALAATFTPVTYWWATALAGAWNDPRGEVLVVLGGGLESSGFPAAGTLRRIHYGLLAWREGGFREIVVCGGAPPGQQQSVAAQMRQMLVFSGVPAGAIVMESGSQTTEENARNTAAMLGGAKGHIVLLTSDYHMRRAAGAFRRAGLRVLPRPIPDARSRYRHPSQRWPLLYELAEETAKLFYYKLRGWA